MPDLKNSFRAAAASVAVIAAPAFAGIEIGQKEMKAPVPEEDKTSIDLFEVQATYTGRSDFRDAKFGHGDSFYSDFSYGHRFLLSGHWYFRAGLEYERYDFGGSSNGLPSHLQAAYASLAVEYIIQDHAGAGIELHPGFYFENHVRGEAFDIPWDVYFTVPVVKDKLFVVLGVGGSLYQDPPVSPGGGIIWLISDTMRLEGVFPKPALVWYPVDNWEFRLLGEITGESFRTDDVESADRKLRFTNAVVQYTEAHAGVQASFSGFKPFEIALGAGYTFERTFDFFRAERRETTEGAPYVQLTVDANF